MALLPKRIAPPDRRETAEFYDSLSEGKVSRLLWGAERRFNADKIAASPSVQRYFERPLRSWISAESRVLDVGCTSGGFLSLLARIAGDVTGIDIPNRFVNSCRDTLARLGLGNSRVLRAACEALPFPDRHFDAVVITDVFHHMDALEPCLREVRRVLRDDGTLLVFEPNKLNPLLYAMCVVDRNEWGLLRLASKLKYADLLRPWFRVGTMEYSGLLIGPDGPAFMAIAERLNSGVGKKWLAWLNPKIFIAARKSA